MTSFLVLDLQEYVIKQKITPNNNDIKACMCCTSQNTVFIHLSTCSHTAFLRNILNINIDPKNLYICNICHNMLKKIEIFKQQVQDSVALLTDQAPILKINKLHNFQQSPVEIYGEQKTEILKPETDDIFETLTYENIETDVKIEQIFSDVEAETSIVPKNEMKSVKTSKSKKSQEVLHGGKIGVVILSEEEFLEERKKMATSENYLKLPYKCESCIVGFDREVTLKTHMEKRHTMKKNSFQCNICLSVLNNRFSITEHTKRHTRRMECLICGKRYVQLQSAVQHYDEQHAEAGSTIQPGFSCKQCTFRTRSHRSYRYHLEKHKSKATCEICGNTFVNNSGLKVHMHTVHNKSFRVYNCDQCDKSYSRRSGLLAHKRTVHAPAVTRAFCTGCKTHFQTRQGLVHHLATHSKHVTENDWKFICNECGAKFVTKSKLKTHINWEHFQMNLLKCSKCNKPFKSVNSLNRHVAYVHQKKRPPRNKICDYCGRGFTTQAILVSHIRTHTGERPLHCNHCPATFAHSAALYTHNKLLHGGIK